MPLGRFHAAEADGRTVATTAGQETDVPSTTALPLVLSVSGARAQSRSDGARNRMVRRLGMTSHNGHFAKTTIFPQIWGEGWEKVGELILERRWTASLTPVSIASTAALSTIRNADAEPEAMLAS